MLPKPILHPFFLLTLIPLSISSIFLIILLLTSNIVKIFVGSYLRLKYGLKVEFLDGLDVIHIRKHAENQIIPQGFFVIKGKQNLQKIQNLVTRKWLNNPNTKLTKSIDKCCGYYYWRPVDSFQIDQHVKIYNCNPPRNNRDLDVICGEISCLPIPVDKTSPWDLFLFELSENYEGLEPVPHYVFFLRLHHTITDGVAIIRMLTYHLMGNADQVFSKNRESMCKFSKLSKVLKTIYLLPISLYQMSVLRDVNILHGPKLSGVKIFAMSQEIPLQRMKRIKNLFGCTINDVFMSCLTSALRKYFVSRKSEVPNRVRALLPVSFHSLSKLPEWENNCAFVVLSLAILKDDLVERLCTTKRRMQRLKKNWGVVQSHLMCKLGFNTLPECMTRPLVGADVTVVVSNVPGPAKDSFVNRDEVVKYGSLIPHNNNAGVSFSLLSFKEMIQFGLLVDRAIINEESVAYEILNDCVGEIESLEKLTDSIY